MAGAVAAPLTTDLVSAFASEREMAPVGDGIPERAYQDRVREIILVVKSAAGDS